MVAKALVAVASCIGAGGALADPIFVYGTAGPLNPTLTNIFPQSDQNLYTASEPIGVILNYKPSFYGLVGQGLAYNNFLNVAATGGGERRLNFRHKRSSSYNVPYHQQATVREIPSTVVSKQYHSQDDQGNYKYGYTNPHFEKHESGNANSEVKGHYSYIDEEGKPRMLYYVADSHGFHITGDDVPTGTQTFLRHKRSPLSTVPSLTLEPSSLQSHSTGGGDTVISKQYHSQDDFGSYKYGYSNPHSEKQESGNAETEVRGRYRYLDGNGLNRIVEYIADRHGFHVKLDGAPVPDKKYFA